MEFIVSDNSKWSNLRTSTRCSWDANRIGLALLHVEQFRELIDTLTDIHETLGETGEVNIIVLIDHTYHLH